MQDVAVARTWDRFHEADCRTSSGVCVVRVLYCTPGSAKRPPLRWQPCGYARLRSQSSHTADDRLRRRRLMCRILRRLPRRCEWARRRFDKAVLPRLWNPDLFLGADPVPPSALSALHATRREDKPKLRLARTATFIGLEPANNAEDRPNRREIETAQVQAQGCGEVIRSSVGPLSRPRPIHPCLGVLDVREGKMGGGDT